MLTHCTFNYLYISRFQGVQPTPTEELVLVIFLPLGGETDTHQEKLAHGNDQHIIYHLQVYNSYSVSSCNHQNYISYSPFPPPLHPPSFHHQKRSSHQKISHRKADVSLKGKISGLGGGVGDSIVLMMMVASEGSGCQVGKGVFHEYYTKKVGG